MKISKMTRSRRKKMTVLILIPPILVFLVSLREYPLLKVVHDSSFHVSLTKPGIGFTGLDNFKTIMADERFKQTVVNTIYWTAFSVLGEYLMRMVTTILLNKEFRGRAFLGTMIFILWPVPIIVTGMTWDWMLNTELGAVNFMLNTLHVASSPIDFLGDTGYTVAVVILINIWRSFPYYTISFLPAIQFISGDLMEAAAIDRAGVTKRFLYITLSQLKSVSLATVLLYIIWAAISSDFTWVFAEGGPSYVTWTLPIMTCRYSTKKLNVGAASTLSIMIFVVMAVISVVYHRQRMKISESLEQEVQGDQ